MPLARKACFGSGTIMVLLALAASCHNHVASLFETSFETVRYPRAEAHVTPSQLVFPQTIEVLPWLASTLVPYQVLRERVCFSWPAQLKASDLRSTA